MRPLFFIFWSIAYLTFNKSLEATPKSGAPELYRYVSQCWLRDAAGGIEFWGHNT